MKCQVCRGKGEVYLKIGEDVHIAECSECVGTGEHDAVKETIKPYRHFGSVNINELLEEDNA